MSETILNKEAIEYGLYVTMETIICYKCAIPFAVPQKYKSYLQSSQETFYCPSGHNQCYIKSTEQKLREQIEQQKQAHEREQKILTDRVLDEIGEKNRAVAKLKRTEKRIANGVCPCCNRTFKDLAAHMKTKHPEQLK